MALTWHGLRETRFLRPAFSVFLRASSLESIAKERRFHARLATTRRDSSNRLISIRFSPQPFEWCFGGARHAACTHPDMPDPQVKSAPRQNQTRSRLGIVFAVLMMLGGVGIYFWTRPVRFTSAGESGSAVAYTFPLETFVVNLNGSERAYLRVGISLGLSRAPTRREDLPVAMVRDTIVSILSEGKPEELAQPEGKGKLKSEILQALKDRMPQLGVQDVYFTE